MRKSIFTLALLSVSAWSSMAHAAAISYVKANATLSIDNAQKVYTGPTADPHRSELDVSGRFNWGTVGKPDTWKCHYATPGKGRSDAGAAFGKEAGKKITANTFIDIEAQDGGLAFGFADVTQYQLELRNITGALGTAQDFWTDWTLTVDWQINLSTGSGDEAHGAMVVGVDSPDGRQIISHSYEVSNGDSKNEPAGGADETRSFSWKVPGKAGGIGKLTISLDSFSSGLAFAGDPPPAAPPGGDFGDVFLPYPSPTLPGPKYDIGATRLGSQWDREDVGRPSVGADFDDNNPAGEPDDEDGIFWGEDQVVVGITSNQATERMAHLDCWIDTDGNDVFEHDANQVLDELLLVTPGYTEFAWDYASLGLDPAAIEDQYARVRLTLVDDPGNLLPGGVDELTDVTPESENLAAEDGPLLPGMAYGEVEDYLIHLVPEPAMLVMLLGGLAALLAHTRRNRQRR